MYCNSGVTLTRSNLIFVVNKMCQFMTTRKVLYWITDKQILRYLLGTLGYGLEFECAIKLLVNVVVDSN